MPRPERPIIDVSDLRPGDRVVREGQSFELVDFWTRRRPRARWRSRCEECAMEFVFAWAVRFRTLPRRCTDCSSPG